MLPTDPTPYQKLVEQNRSEQLISESKPIKKMWLLLLLCVVFFMFSGLHLADLFADWSVHYETLPLDEAPLAVLFGLLIMTWGGWHYQRRSNHQQQALQTQQRALTYSLRTEIDKQHKALQKRKRRCKESCMARKNLRMTAAAFESSKDAIAILGADHRITDVNPAYVAITGYSRDELLGSSPDRHSDDQLQPLPPQMQRDLQASGHCQGETWKQHKDGRRIPVWLTLTAVSDKQGLLTNLIAIFSDISQQQDTKAQLHKQAYRDPLTGLPNRACFYQHVARVLRESRTLGRKPVILLLDLDEFKQVNDTLGHRFGDLLLRQAAQRMKRCLGQNDMLARQGGDEFAVMVDDDEQVDGHARVAENLLSSLVGAFNLEGKEVYIRASLGIYTADPEHDSAESIIQKADIAMYRAKDQGKGCYRYYDASLNTLMQRKGLLTAALHQAIEQNQLHLCYQVQVDASTASPVGMEALLRWTHPELGVVSPFEFIPLAEACGLILPIGDWVLSHACWQLAEWQRQGMCLPVAVNVSADQFYDDHLVDRIITLLHQNGIPPALLEIEVTESAAMSNPDKTIKQLQTLKQLGVKIAIDDFGTGYSSLSYLKKLPASKLKIDREFVKNIATDAYDHAITKSVIALSHTMDLQVVAEGVETDQVSDLLIAMNCDVIQGYLYSRPVPAAEIMTIIPWLQSQSRAATALQPARLHC